MPEGLNTNDKVVASKWAATVLTTAWIGKEPQAVLTPERIAATYKEIYSAVRAPFRR